jgi:hypothetical protein
MAAKIRRVTVGESPAPKKAGLGTAISWAILEADRSPLYPKEALKANSIAKAFLERIPGSSRQDAMIGWKEHPFNFSSAAVFKLFNVHQSACIEAKVASTVGLGFRREPVMEKVPGAPAVARDVEIGVAPEPATPDTEATKLDPLTGKPQTEGRSAVSRTLDDLCLVSFQDILTDAIEDYWQTGNGYVEVVRNKGGSIIALFHCPSRDVHVVLEENGKFHYEVNSSEGTGFNRLFARFGDLSRVKSAKPGALGGSSRPPEPPTRGRPGRPSTGDAPEPPPVTELIHFRRSTSFSRYYGYPDWLAAVLSIELSQCSHQHLYDFFLNRGVPELLIVVKGARIPKDEWDEFKTNLRNHIGLKNSHKTMAINLGQAEAELDVHPLAAEGKVDGLFSELADVLAMEIVSAHGVPPLLAGIQIPGKLGATNELPNAMLHFQKLKIGPAQHSISGTLTVTLGKDFPEIQEDDWALRTILEEQDMQQMDTMARMREPVTGSGRDLSAGLKKSRRR